MSAHPFRLAVESADGAWIEITPQRPEPVRRFRAPTLRDAADHAARSPGAAFVDLDVYLADTVAAAFDGLARLRPGWTPGAVTATVVHAGTPSTLAGLLWDMWAAHVADGVTLRSEAPEALAHTVATAVIPLLTARGLAVESGSAAAVA
ncbi:hypothetical protein HUN08_08285 [Gordonia sp. X0973]|uniref:hypothetical protein n=1 Tax=Gordonia sp. X0973 TaxID=2742602 RepID=UPI000F53059A|nr:hypothetical protein [Gordonia sp. X0973]QKT07193.1 hypothetical protein HUN08_08285 [Gordonia sp. X0973]